jgi:hypothetical protein
LQPNSRTSFSVDRTQTCGEDVPDMRYLVLYVSGFKLVAFGKLLADRQLKLLVGCRVTDGGERLHEVIEV